jgi:hypothetical protein
LDTRLTRSEGAPSPTPAPAAAARPPAGEPRLVDGLGAELTAGEWSFPWRLGTGIEAPARPSSRWLAWSLAAIIEGPCRDALLLADEPHALLVGAADGRLAHRLLDWGAERVVACEGSERGRRRAKMIAEQLRVPSSRLEIAGPELPAERFAVVVVAPGAAVDEVLEAACEATSGVCAIVTAGAETTAVAERALAAGLSPIEIATVPRHAHPQYVLGEREVLIGRRSGSR